MLFLHFVVKSVLNQDGKNLKQIHIDIPITDGVRMDELEYFGRVLIATRDFAVGEVVLSEFPILIWDKIF